MSSSDPRPVALVTSSVTPYRVEPFLALHAREEIEVVAWGPPGAAAHGLRVRQTSQRGAARLLASGSYRAIVAGLGGRLALPGAYAGARATRVPFVLWASIWGHPRSAAHLLSLLPTRALYARADAVITYGPHVSRYVKAHRRRSRVFEAPQAVSPGLFGAEVAAERSRAVRLAARVGAGDLLVLFVGRLEEEKGLRVLLAAWQRAALGAGAVLAVAGEGPLEPELRGHGARVLGRVEPEALPALYAAADVLVLPSIRTATFLEPWGLVVNEAMHQGTPIIATDAVGAAAGGLVKDGRNGLVVPQGDPVALARALSALAADRDLRERLGSAARADVAAYTPEAWARGVSLALAALGAGRRA